MSILDSVLRAGEGRLLRRLEALTGLVNSFEPDFAAMTDEELAGMTDEFRTRLAEGEAEIDLLPEAYAVVREASSRVLSMRHFDVQIMGGIALHLGNIAEMKTGEGKTLVATLPSYLNALSGRGVHVVTTNDYLATRDAENMGRIHSFLGLSVGVITGELETDERRRSYAADITYGTNNEFGFDYLRDNMATAVEDLVQRGHHFAVVDEVDSILIDEARTPLIISGLASDDTAWYREFARIVTRLKRTDDYDVDEKKKTVGLLSSGVAKVEDWLGTTSLFAPEHTQLVGYLNSAVRAKELFLRDKDYVVIDAEVLIVDEHTGRVLPGRRYSDGLHQAIEAKEAVNIEPENQTLATITLQNYFRSYTTLSGMTGTASSEAAEFHQIYGLGVVPIPTNRPNRRVDSPDVIYRTEEAKFAAVVADITVRHEAGQPVLVGTTSVEKSEHVSELLTQAGVAHQVLNAKRHAEEAHVIAQAGRAKAVTVATNMAGRGTDIILGGNTEELARDLYERQVRASDDDQARDELRERSLADAHEVVAAERALVLEAGGLYVVGTERHESRRIDNQLRGRSARQGDPGLTRFYLSLEDELVRRFSGQMLTRAVDMLGIGDAPLTSKMVNRAIASAQSSMEARNYEARKDVLKYDDVLSRQRGVIYTERLRILHGHDVGIELVTMADSLLNEHLRALSGYPENWDVDAFLTGLREYVPTAPDLEGLLDEAGVDQAGLSLEQVKILAHGWINEALAAREEEMGATALAQLQRLVLLNVIDARWRAHLHEMDYLREGIHMRSMAQRDPLVEYQREAFTMFEALLDIIRHETVGYVLNVQTSSLPDFDVEAGTVDAADDQDDEDEQSSAVTLDSVKDDSEELPPRR